MRKIILQIFMISILLSFVSCSDGSETAYFSNVESEPEIAVIEVFEENLQDAEPHDADIYDAYIFYDEPHPQENVPRPTDLHPFATALKEYMAGYDGVIRAYLATLDDEGTMGVLTTRPTTRVLYDYDSRAYRYGASGTLFYIQDDELLQIDASGWLFVAGRYNRLMKRLYAHTHIVEFIYKLEFGRLETSTRLEYFSDEYLSFLFDDDYDTVAELIAERDARAEYAREKYGLVAQLPPNLGHMRNMEDQTTQILAMTISCVPSLATTSIIESGDNFRVIQLKEIEISDLFFDDDYSEAVFVLSIAQ